VEVVEQEVVDRLLQQEEAMEQVVPEQEEVMELEVSSLVSGKPRQPSAPEKTTMPPSLRGCAKKRPPSRKKEPVPPRPRQEADAASKLTFWTRRWAKSRACTR
jgi:hypothetical protein